MQAEEAGVDREQEVSTASVPLPVASMSKPQRRPQQGHPPPWSPPASPTNRTPHQLLPNPPPGAPRHHCHQERLSFLL